jgi:hypothetical protein
VCRGMNCRDMWQPLQLHATSPLRERHTPIAADASLTLGRAPNSQQLTALPTAGSRGIWPHWRHGCQARRNSTGQGRFGSRQQG